ncbi:MAG: DNA alkylation repair protein [Lachnospiraceae bacterium]|nr:DNA alkylation repair protein [Lachnospiraceae bacterium]
MKLTKDQAWNAQNYQAFLAFLHAQIDEPYRDFQSKLIPGCTKPLLGVRMPILRKLAKDLAKTDWRSFLSVFEGKYYEEVMVRALLLGAVRPDFEEFCQLVDSQVELTDNWAFCDAFCGGLKIVRDWRAELFPWFSGWLTSDNPWRVRVALVLFLEHYLEPDYIDAVIALCDSVSFDHYYVKMAQAWLLSMCYVHFRDKTQAYLETETNLDKWTYNKTLQKCRESFRVSAEDKALLKEMRR